MTKEEYIDYISEELDQEIIRCEKICELLNEITSFDETKFKSLFKSFENSYINEKC